MAENFPVLRWPGIAIHNATLMRGIKRTGRVGAVIRKPAQDAFWGSYSGYFSDLDRHLWEVAHFPLSDDGRLQLPDRAALSLNRSQPRSFAVDLERPARTHRGNGQKNQAKPASTAK
jgi:hypothetical protein